MLGLCFVLSTLSRFIHNNCNFAVITIMYISFIVIRNSVTRVSMFAGPCIQSFFLSYTLYILHSLTGPKLETKILVFLAGTIASILS